MKSLKGIISELSDIVIGNGVLRNIDYGLLNECEENNYLTDQLLKGDILAAAQSLLTASLIYMTVRYQQPANFVPAVAIKGVLYLVSREERVGMNAKRELLLENLRMQEAESEIIDCGE